MRFVGVALFFLAGCGTQSMPDRIDWPIVAYPLNEMTLNRPDVIAAFDLLLRKAAYGHLGEERAGFLVLDDDRFQMIVWPPSHRFHAEEWRGKVPNGTVAVVHTHPAGQPLPSAHDLMEAQRVGVPMIVVTPMSVALATENGRIRLLHINPMP
jgi:Prokaryotic homologs of the JAB domain